MTLCDSTVDIAKKINVNSQNIRFCLKIGVNLLFCLLTRGHQKKEKRDI